MICGPPLRRRHIRRSPGTGSPPSGALGSWVRELESNAVQKGAIETQLLLKIAVGRPMSVTFITEHGVRNRGEVAPNLVVRPSSGLRAGSEWPPRPQQPKTRSRRHSLPSRAGHAGSHLGFRATLDDYEIDLATELTVQRIGPRSV